MMKTPSAQTLSLCILAALIAAAAGWAGLSWLSRPQDFGARVTTLQGNVDEIRRLSRASRVARDYVPGSLCASSSETELARIAEALQGRAQQLNLNLGQLSIAPGEAVGQTAVKVSMQLEASGPYAGVTALLADMSRQTPSLFVDRADLLDRSSQVTLRFSGHFYCATAA